MTLTDFLLARIAEDEAVARQAMQPPMYARPDEGPPWYCDEQTDHVALSAARVLAECRAKRAIVEAHREPHKWCAGEVYLDPDSTRM